MRASGARDARLAGTRGPPFCAHDARAHRLHDLADIMSWLPRSTRHSPALLALLGAALLAACAATPAGTQTSATPAAARPQPATSATPVASASAPAASGKVVCDLVCESPQVVAKPADPPDYTAKATRDASNVIAAMQPDLLACYKKRIAANPQAQGFLVVDVIVGEDGKVRSAEAIGGGNLGDATLDCIVNRIKKGEFGPHHGGGTMQLRVPFSLRRALADEGT